MITAVDTNVLLDLLVPGAPHSAAAEQALAQADQNGAVVIGEAVYAELAAHFSTPDALEAFLADTRTRLVPSQREALQHAGHAWAAYGRRKPRLFACPRCGSDVEATCPACGEAVAPRQHVLADFLIGAHAESHADALLTRDRGYYATHFPGLRLL